MSPYLNSVLQVAQTYPKIWCNENKLNTLTPNICKVVIMHVFLVFWFNVKERKKKKKRCSFAPSSGNSHQLRFGSGTSQHCWTGGVARQRSYRNNYILTRNCSHRCVLKTQQHRVQDKIAEVRLKLSGCQWLLLHTHTADHLFYQLTSTSWCNQMVKLVTDWNGSSESRTEKNECCAQNFAFRSFHGSRTCARYTHILFVFSPFQHC